MGVRCQYGVVEERMNTETWWMCQALARGRAWKYFKEEKSCHLLGTQDKNCLVKFGVADPYKKCGGGSIVPPAAGASVFGQSVGGASESYSGMPSSYYYF